MYKLLLVASLLLSQPTVLEIQVRGMVCSFCAQGLSKGIKKMDEVKDVKMDIKTGWTTITLHDGKQINMKELEKIIIDSGYELQSTKRK